MNYRLILFRHRGCSIATRKTLITLAAIMFLYGALVANAAPEQLAANDVEINGLHATMVRMVIDRAHSFTELIGNVRITQGSTIITADNVKIFTKNKQAVAEQARIAESPAGSLEKLVANGSVRIEFDSGVATSEMAIYNVETKIIALSGPGTKFVRGDNTITGRTITVDRETGNVTVEDAEAVIFSDDKL